MAVHNRNDLGKILKQRRLMTSLTLQELSARSGVSMSHLGRIERHQRYPSARTLRKLAKPLGFAEDELFTLAGYLPSQPFTAESSGGRLDPYVAGVLSQEPVEVQQVVVGILFVLKSIAQAHATGCPEFRKYAHRKYPNELDEDLITMIEDLIEHRRAKM